MLSKFVNLIILIVLGLSNPLFSQQLHWSSNPFNDQVIDYKGENKKGIAFIMPNKKSDELEVSLGFDLFTLLPDSIESV